MLPLFSEREREEASQAQASEKLREGEKIHFSFSLFLDGAEEESQDDDDDDEESSSKTSGSLEKKLKGFTLTKGIEIFIY